MTHLNITFTQRGKVRHHTHRFATEGLAKAYTRYLARLERNGTIRNVQIEVCHAWG